MRRFLGFGLVLVLLGGCAATTAPNGMNWDEFHAAKSNLAVTYQPAEVSQCEEVGQVRGSNYNDGSAAKEDAQEQAVMIGGNTLLYTNLWTEWRFYQLFRSLRELHHAEGTVYICPL